MIIRSYDFNIQNNNKNNYLNNKKLKNNTLYEKQTLNASKPIQSLYLYQLPNVKFKGNRIAENFIVDDIFNFSLKNIKDTFSKNLTKIIKELEYSFTKSENLNQIFILKKSNEEILKVHIPNNHDNFKIGFAIGKGGLYSTLTLKSQKGKYQVILPEGSELKTKDGLYIKVGQKSSNNISFKGPSATVNVFYKPEKTKNSISSFLSKENSILFKEIKKINKDYSQFFHPYILAGGFGTRLEILSYQNNDNKPSTPIPISGWNLIDFNLLNLYQANLFNNKTNVNYYMQKTANGPAGCFVAALGYTIHKTDKGIDLLKTNESVVPNDKNTIIMPSDNITDINFSSFLDDYLLKDDIGIMVVGIPVSKDVGGLIIQNEDNTMKQFIENPNDVENCLEKGLIKYEDKDGNLKTFKDKDGNPCYLGNAFIHIINPQIHLAIVDIYRKKIQNEYSKLLKANNYNKNEIKDEDYLKAIEGLWGRDIIPELIKLSNEGNLKNKNGKNLKVYTFQSLDNDWDDVGNYNKYYSTLKNVTKDDSYKNIPKTLKKAIASNIQDNIIYNIDVQEDFEEFLNGGFVHGNVIVMPKQ